MGWFPTTAYLAWEVSDEDKMFHDIVTRCHHRRGRITRIGVREVTDEVKDELGQLDEEQQLGQEQLTTGSI